MATLKRAEILSALGRLGQHAAARGTEVRLLLVGGALMALAYEARDSTKDVDAVALEPESSALVRELAQEVASEFGWPGDWLNDGAKGYLVGSSEGPVVFSAPGIEVRSPSVAQLLAMKLSAWRDDVDVSDARVLLRQLRADGNHDDIWNSVSRFLPLGSELKAQYAFDDLWEEAK